MKKINFMVFFLLVAFNCNAEMIGEIRTSGLLIKDSLEIHAFDDPDIKGVTCYVTIPKKHYLLKIRLTHVFHVEK